MEEMLRRAFEAGWNAAATTPLAAAGSQDYGDAFAQFRDAEYERLGSHAGLLTWVLRARV